MLSPTTLVVQEQQEESSMAFLDQIGDVLERYASANAGNVSVNREQAHDDYDRIATAVPGPVLGSVIGPAMSSLAPQEVETRIRNSATEMPPPVRAQFFNTLLSAIAQSGGNIGAILAQLGINPAVAQQPGTASPADVAKVTAHAMHAHPDAFNKAMSFYSEHPTLVKVLGTLAIAKIAQQVSSRAPQLSR
jgi:hypothetical protein